ncbi:aKG-HExxH-type peptide beta-hydroxylase [Actinophytocola sp.]|uniref:aKG-HExxH-type peptide beta-hydroxylase n=1 Tax=Actinophytocola sp. TaxID=1872138 RepID=UPI003899DBE6
MVHRLSRAQFDAFCAGPVDADVVAALRAAQHSRRRLLISALVDATTDDHDTAGSSVNAEEAWQILVTADECAPDVVEDVLMRPSVGVWLVRAVRRSHGVDLDGPPLWVEVGFLGSLAAAVAMRAELSCAVDVPVVAGVVTLPTIGQIRLPDHVTSVVTLSVTSTGVALHARSGDRPCDLPQVLGAPEFVPVHRHEVVRRGTRMTVELDDATPYRLFAAPEPPQPLEPEELTRWRRDIDGAWDVLTRWHPRSAAELSAGLTTLTPMTPPGKLVAASASAAFGGALLSAAGSPIALAATLVHELQHSKLNALLDLVLLCERDNSALGYAPWREDPRPLTGLLHGIYAFVSTVEFWHVQRGCAPDKRRATFSFIRTHRQVRLVVDDLRADPGLTGPGRALVESVARRLTRCAVDDDVPAEMTGAVDTSIVDHRARWRLRHVRPDDADVDAALAAWRARTAMPAVRQKYDVIEPDRRAVVQSDRGRLLTMKVVDPVRFGDVVDRPDDLRPGDAAFAAGRHDEAIATYVERLLSTPLDADAWLGLALASRAKGDGGADAFLRAPEVALGVQERLGSTMDDDPLEFVRRLGA